MENSNKINALTGIRAIAVLWVVLYHSLGVFYLPQPHMNGFADFANPVLPTLITQGYFSGDLFFILSGFVMPYVYYSVFARADSKTQWLSHYKHYVIFRFARIYPAFLFVFLAGSALVLMHLTIFPAYKLQNYMAFLKSLPTIITLTYTIQLETIRQFLNAYWSYNSSIWTISIEWLSYLCFPLVATLTASLRKFDLLLLVLFLLMILQFYIFLDAPTIHHVKLDSISYFIFGLPAITRVGIDFFLGYFCYRIFADFKLPINVRYIDLIILCALSALIVMLYDSHTAQTIIIFLLAIL